MTKFGAVGPKRWHKSFQHKLLFYFQQLIEYAVTGTYAQNRLRTVGRYELDNSPVTKGYSVFPVENGCNAFSEVFRRFFANFKINATLIIFGEIFKYTRKDIAKDIAIRGSSEHQQRSGH
ncbi:hypothetical protein SDC9_177594 [bioreactor metagenome]|uniref:Uncharacterized protein n=1 Tax=bioreactor metagenome TaxID=1076179 RepID=A0A645GV53_9ZZZZ